MADLTPPPASPASTRPKGARAYGAKDTFELVGCKKAWQVVRGNVDVFLINRELNGERYYVTSVAAGQCLFGVVDNDDAPVSLLAVPGNNSALGTFSLDDKADGLEFWVDALTEALPGSAEVPKVETPEDLGAFNAAALTTLNDLQRQSIAHDLERITARDTQRRQALEASVDSLSRVIEDRKAVTTSSQHPLFAACEVAAASIGVTLSVPRGGPEAIDRANRPVELIARASHIQSRLVALPPGWWKRDAGPLVARLNDGGYCALVPIATGGYRMVVPTERIQSKVTAEIAATIAPEAEQLCEPLPDGPVTAKELLSFCSRGALLDGVVIVLMVLFAGLLSLVPPLATEVVFDTVIPSNHLSMAYMIGAGVLLSGVALALFNLVQGIAVLRIEGRLDLRLQNALWDRLTRIPASFYRNISSGDLVGRTQMLNAVRKLLTGSMISSVVSGIMGVFSFALMVHYAPILAAVMAVLTCLISLFGLFLGRRMVSLDRQVMMQNNAIQSTVVQFLGGLDKLRISATEDVAFRRWAGMFHQAQSVTNKSNHANVALMALMMGMMAPLALLALFVTVGIQSGEIFAYFQIPSTWDQVTGKALESVMPTAQFIAFFTAYVQFILAVTDLMTVGIRLSAVPPMLGQLKPIFQTPTEHFGAKLSPGEVAGKIDFNNVTFRYEASGPTILKNFSLSINPGEFVALVGPSGSGKSSALRLLLGFESPESGSVYVDGRDMAPLDKVALRQQFGVVVQDGRLIPGTILDNITGGADIPREVVWAAAEQAGFAADLRKMPRDLDTAVNDGATNLSGGQRQRLFIARALVRNPRVLILDEATSALDNETQEIVSRTVETLGVTRIAVAHRLSTILKADRIFVVVAGTVTESGTYQELMEEGGVFADLMQRQTE